MNKREFKKLQTGLEEVLAYKKGNLQLHSEIFEVIKPPKKYRPQDVKRIRTKWHHSQSSFAYALNISVKTIQAWESGLRKPSGIALRVLEAIERGNFQLPKGRI